MSKPAAKPVPDGMHTVTPHLVCAGATEAMAFYAKAFGAVELFKLAGADGKLMHGCIRIGDSQVFLNDEFPDYQSFGPGKQGSPVTIHLQVEDSDAVYNRAVAAGCTVVMPIADMFWGDRYGSVKDPYGHLWAMASHKVDMSPEEIQEAMKKMG